MKNYGDGGGCFCRGRRPRWITPSEISIILHIIRKPNSIIVLLSIQNNSYFKNIAKTGFPPSFLSSSSIVHVQGFQLRKYSPTADVALRVVFLLFLPCFQLLFRLVLTLETIEMSTIFIFTTKTTQPRPQVFSVNGALTCKEAVLLMSLVH